MLSEHVVFASPAVESPLDLVLGLGWDINIFDLQARSSALALTDQHAKRQTNLSLVEMSAGHWFYVWRLWDLDPTSSPGGVLFRAQLFGSLRPFRVQCPTCHLGLMQRRLFYSFRDI